MGLGVSSARLAIAWLLKAIFKQKNVPHNVIGIVRQVSFDAPKVDAPVALNLGSMGKGEAWINGQSIGRYWPSYRSPSGSSQLRYSL